ncbi:energy-coupling factor ABC transporter substrate-binding protein [Lysinibacillus yapensis]|uniref:Cobalt transport protein CbiN n=1 Tax=Ureibacillus yapensis TaxID=2304605 RepID=A0A396SDU9_9BACL|nr:energy-coupling factor ABC transporter substrate-binding protein [Lysinibacillus yapensis]RHW39465.1 energy-coupling factor ABC transporter substrate-binding protein [Lysinibacillus yapensis]
MWRKNIILFSFVVILTIFPLIFLQDADFDGADGKAEEAITDIAVSYEPWFHAIWEPPSGEVESLLFVLQAIIGAGFIGYFIGFMRGRSKNSKVDS